MIYIVGSLNFLSLTWTTENLICRLNDLVVLNCMRHLQYVNIINFLMFCFLLFLHHHTCYGHPTAFKGET